MKKNKDFIWLISCIASLTIGMWLGNMKATYKYENRPPVATPEPVKLLECVAWRCPVFESIEVDNNLDTRETMVFIPVSLTKAAGKIQIIRNGENIFETPALAQLDIEVPENGNGFMISYWTDWDDLENPVWSEAKFEYLNGKFVQVSGPSLFD